MENQKSKIKNQKSDKRLDRIFSKLANNSRLSKEDGIIIYESQDLLGIGYLADYVRRARHGNKAYFVCNQHLNYTNICRNRCLFCAYACDKGDTGAYVLSMNEVERQLMAYINEPVRELHIVGGLNEELGFDYYLELLSTVKRIRPDAAIKAFTCVEIDYLSDLSGLSIEETINRLKEAGLDMMPGGGAEILNSRIHSKLFPRKIGHERWLEIVEAVHRAGIKTNATMLYGHIETIEERVDHLIKLREVQDKTQGFSAFIPLAFHSKNTELPHISRTKAVDDLKNIAAARLLLDNFEHIKAYWVMIGEGLAQVGLSFGADDLDGTIMEERITHTAGAKSARGHSRKAMADLISSAGFEPVERDSFYKAVSSLYL